MTSRYVRPAGRVYAPSAILAVVPECTVAFRDSTSDTIALAMRSISLAYSVRRRGKWSPVATDSPDNASDVLSAIESYAQPRRRLFVVSPVASETLRLLGFWSHVTSFGAKWDRVGLKAAGSLPVPEGEHTYYFSSVVLAGKPDIVKYRTGDRGITWVSGIQFFQQPESELAKCISSDTTLSSGNTSSECVTDRSTTGRCLLWLSLFQRLCDWWLSVRGGPFGLTTGQLAMNYFRERVTPRTVVKHDRAEALRVEELALFGGRASTFFYGDIDNGEPLPTPHEPPPPRSPYWTLDQPAHHVDVRSMYPFLLASRDYPVKPVSCVAGRSIREVRELLDNYCVIANVQVAARVNEYPYRRDGDICYPTGRFHTTLCGDELRSAIDRDEVARVFTTAVYERGRPFECMANELIRLRSDHRRQGQSAWELFVKALSNSFGGKLAQKRNDWIQRPDVPCELPDGWGQWSVSSGGILRRYRALAHLVWECVEHRGKGRPLGMCFAYLTMYGRWHMRCIRETLPVQSVLSQDTDGLWILPSALAACALCKTNGPESAGMLRHTHTTGRARWLGPKWYYACGRWVLSGYHEPSVDPETLCVTDWHSEPVRGCPPTAPDSTISRFRRQTSLHTIPKESGVLPSGWVEPLLLR